MDAWKTVSTRIVYENPWTTFREDVVINPAGQEVTYGIMEAKSGSAYVIPVDDDGNIYIVKQYRYPIQQDSWECIAGGADATDLEAGARRELLEEAGMIADKFELIGACHASAGRTTFLSHIYIATGITKVSDELDAVDGISALRKVSLHEAIDMVMRGEITCSQTIAALFMVQEFLKRKQRAN